MERTLPHAQNDMKQIILNKGFVALVDDADYEELNKFRWTAISKKNASTYAQRSCYKRKPPKKYLMHRVILGVTDPSIQIDHADRNGLNNCRSNLRIATQSQNNANRRPNFKRTSNYLGVQPNNSRKNPWRARIQVNGKKINLGCYPNQEWAALAYNAGAKKFFGEFATYNNICAQCVTA